ncbi:MAG: peptide chain release factor N(5)-glutamine methyltransferase [Brumimicrobium sp.]
MFIKNNSVHSVLGYFDEQLASQFTERERKLIGKSFIAKRLGWENTDFLLRKDDKVTESDLLYFRKMIKQLKNGLPFQYVLGETFFYNILLKTDKRALIPRPETEELVDWVVSDLKKSKNLKILDIGTGSGCIPLAIKNSISNATVLGLDVSHDALELAKENANRLKLDVNFIHYDILSQKMEFTNEKWDVIVSNPPYIPKKDKKLMAKHVLEHEPEIALFISDNNPLVFYQKIVDFAKHNLVENGNLYFEIHESLAENVKDLLVQQGFKNVEIKKDLQGKERMIKCKH